MKKMRNITMILILIVSVGLGSLLGWFLWSILQGDNSINYAEYSQCLLYSDHNKQKIDLTRRNNSQSVEATFRNFGKNNGNINQFSSDDLDFIKRCESNMLYQADAKIVAAFNEKKAINYFSTVLDVVKGLTNNKFYSYRLPELVLALDDKEQLSFTNNLIAFANLFVNLFGLSIFQKLIYNLEIDNKIVSNNVTKNNQILALIKVKRNGRGLAQCILFTEHSFQAEMSKNQYQIGFYSTGSNISTFVHEIGHAISNYAGIWPKERLYFNQNITATTGRCTANREPSPITIRGFIDTPNDMLVRYLGRRVVISNNASFQQQLAAWSFIQSGYGRTGGNSELFAEGFAQWLLTPDDKKALNWQVLNEFYGTYFKNYYLI